MDIDEQPSNDEDGGTEADDSASDCDDSIT